MAWERQMDKTMCLKTEAQLSLCKNQIAAEATVLWLPCLAIPRTMSQFGTDGDDVQCCCFQLVLAKAAVWLMKLQILTQSWQLWFGWKAKLSYQQGQYYFQGYAYEEIVDDIKRQELLESGTVPCALNTLF